MEILKTIQVPKLVFDTGKIKVGQRAILYKRSGWYINETNEVWEEVHEGKITEIDENYIRFVSDDAHVNFISDNVYPDVDKIINPEDLQNNLFIKLKILD